MRTTNNTNMPDFLLDWADEKNNGHSVPSLSKASTTFLLKDPTACVLSMRHSTDISSDLQDTAQANTGTALHDSVLSFAAKRGYLIEKGLQLGITLDSGDFILTGQIDAYSPSLRTLIDLKFSKLATFNKNKAKEDTDWFDQLSIYAMLLRENNPNWFDGINRVYNLVNIRDLSKVKEAKAGNSTDQWRIIEWNPQDIIDNIPVALEKIKTNIKKIWDLANVSDEELPICSDEYRYADKVYKIYKRKSKGSEETNKTAVIGHAKYESLEAATEGFNNAGFTDDTHVIKEVGGESIKCEYYCELKNFCPHYKKMMESKNVQTA